MKKIYTKTGDTGTTSLRGGVRVEKDDIRIETNGQIDHLNSLLGVVRTMIYSDSKAQNMINTVQKELMIVMSHIATPEEMSNPRISNSAQITLQLEKEIDKMKKEMGFVIPGNGSSLSAFIHLSRTQTRTVERRLWSLSRQYNVEQDVLTMINRLSDYLFVLAIDKENVEE